MLATQGTISTNGIADVLQDISSSKGMGALLIVKDYDMCKLFFDRGSIVHTDLTQMDASQPSALKGEVGLRLIGKLLQLTTGMYTFTPNELAPIKSVNINLDWKKVSTDLNGKPQSAQNAPVQNTNSRFTQGTDPRLTQAPNSTLTQASDPRLIQNVRMTPGRGGHQTGVSSSQVQNHNSALHKAHNADLLDVPIRLKSSIAANQGLFNSTVRNQVVGRGGGFIRTQTQAEDKRSVIFKLIDGRRSIRDIAVYLDWSIEDIKNILAQLVSEGAVDVMANQTLV